MKRAFPVLIKEYQNDFLVFIPDMQIYTEGKDFSDAMEMARDAIGLKGIDMENDGVDIPKASSYEEAVERANEDADDFSYADGILTFVDVDFAEYRRKVDNRMVRRNVTLPNWLNYKAEKSGVNVSKILQEALIKKLG